MGIDKLPVESRQQLNQILREGVVTGKDVKGLTAEQQEVLSAMLGGSKLPSDGETLEVKDYGVIKAAMDAPFVEAKDAKYKEIAEAKAKGNYGEALWNSIQYHMMPDNSLQQASAGGWLKALFVIVPAVITMVGCTKNETTIVEGNQTEINNNVSVTLQNNINELVKLLKDNNANQEIIMELLSKILEQGANDSKSLKEIIELIQGAGGDLKTVIGLLIKQGKTLDEINNTLKEMGYDTKTIINMLKDQGAQLTDILVALGDQTEILKTLSAGSENIKTSLNAILKAVNEGNSISTENKGLLNNILDKLVNLQLQNPGDNNDSIKALLEQILDEVRYSIESQKEIGNNNVTMLNKILEQIKEAKNDDKYMPILNAIYAKISEAVYNGEEMDTKLYAVLTDILNNMKNFNADMKDFAAMVCTKFNELTESGKANTKAILDAINNNTEVAKGTYCVATEILNNLGKLGDKADSILDAIKGIAVGGGEPVDLSTIEKMLADILAQSKANGDVLTSIDSKLNFVALTLEGLKDQIGEGNEKLLAKLDQILAKIPEGCHCQTIDLSEIIAKLEIIITEIKTNPDKPNEGILDDLDNLDNLLG